jgi:hypothetical protein
VAVNFLIGTGPNTGDNATVLTDGCAVATFTYTGDGGPGEDIITVWVDSDCSGNFTFADPHDWVAKNWYELEVDSITADPAIDFNTIFDSEHEITATISPASDNVTVRLDVTGGDAGNVGEWDEAITDISGQAVLSYSGSGQEGYDVIRVWVDLDGDEVYSSEDDVGVVVYKYWLENYVTGGGMITREQAGLRGKPNKAAYTFGGVVGVLDDDAVGQFQIVDHEERVAWHCSDNFTLINFYGDTAECPEATNDEVVFYGNFTSNKGDTQKLRVWIHDIAEGKSDDMSVWIDFPGSTWFGGYPIDGGNFQVHDHT